MNTLTRLIKAKKKHLVVLSAGSLQSGISGLSLISEGDTAEIIDSVFTPYPLPVQELLAQWYTSAPVLPSLTDCIWLDYKCSRLSGECASALLARVPKSLRQPHALIVNKCLLYKKALPQENNNAIWNWEIGDEQVLLKMFNVPVISGFLRADICAGGIGALPLAIGDGEIARRVGGAVALVNIGLFAHLTIVDGPGGRIVADTDTGPGTCLINRSAADAGLASGFDRDGSFAATGTVQTEALAKLCGHAWFMENAPRQFTMDLAGEFYPCADLDNCAKADQVATMTALTARTVFDCFKRGYKLETPPKAIVISGGGAHNATLIKYLKTYFDPLPVESIETYGIGVDQRTTFSLGFSVAAALRKGISEVPGKIILP